MFERNETQRNHLRQPEKKRGKTPEAKVSTQIDAYLKKIGALVTRANAGFWQDDQGHTIMGAKAGTADKIVLLPGGLYLGLEVKAAKGKTSEAQEKFGARVRRLGGLYIVAHSVQELRTALIEYFGEDIVQRWEQPKKKLARP